MIDSDPFLRLLPMKTRAGKPLLCLLALVLHQKSLYFGRATILLYLLLPVNIACPEHIAYSYLISSRPALGLGELLLVKLSANRHGSLVGSLLALSKETFTGSSDRGHLFAFGPSH